VDYIAATQGSDQHISIDFDSPSVVMLFAAVAAPLVTSMGCGAWANMKPSAILAPRNLCWNSSSQVVS
jgi:hypothetical protein